MIKIDTENGEYLVHVPYSQRSRVKSIPGYRWDPQQKVWIFPKKPFYRDAILAEFGDEATWLVEEESSDPKPPRVLELLAENNAEVST